MSDKIFHYQYARPSVAATVVLFEPIMRHVLIGVRRDTADAYPNAFCIPGGFLDPRIDFADTHSEAVYMYRGETVEECAVREVKEECGIDIEQWQLKLFHVHSDPHTDPRCHVVNVCYYVMLSKDQVREICAGDDLQAILMMDTQTAFEQRDRFAFNHFNILERAVKCLA